MAQRSGSSKRGFAAMDAKKQREIAAKGGRASHGARKKKTTETRRSSGTQALM